MSMSEKHLSYEQRRAEQKKRELAKKQAVTSTERALESLWKLCLNEKNGYTEQEAKAIADACSQLRAIQGGWINSRRRR